MKVSAAHAVHTFPPAELPPGFVTRSYDQIQRIDLYTQAMNRSYEGLWGHLQTSEAEHAHLLPQLKQEGMFLLFAPDGAVAGVCRGYMSERLTAQRGLLTAYVDAPGVVPHYRSAGLYLPLLLTALHWLLPQGPAAIELESWGDAPETLALYRELGFTVIKEEISYRRELA
jgi:mycothiol synthase